MIRSKKIILEEHEVLPKYDTEIATKKSTKIKLKLSLGKMKVVKMDNVALEIDFIGFHTSLINAYRRIILAEVPTVAIEKVLMYNNTSIVQDEVLSHRLGLIPLDIDPRSFEYRKKASDIWGPQDAVKYKLQVKCSRRPEANAKTTLDLDTLYKDRKVFSSQLKWVPLGNQANKFPRGLPPLHDDILLAKMNPGHEINLEVYALKSIGSDHAKFQPGLSWYRLLPEIELTREIKGNDADLLQKCFSPGVISIAMNQKGEKIATVKDARYDSCSRNIFRHAQFKDCVQLTRKTDHFIFHVESNSFLKSDEILEEAVKVMISKCGTLLSDLNKYIDD